MLRVKNHRLRQLCCADLTGVVCHHPTICSHFGTFPSERTFRNPQWATVPNPPRGQSIVPVVVRGFTTNQRLTFVPFNLRCDLCNWGSRIDGITCVALIQPANVKLPRQQFRIDVDLDAKRSGAKIVRNCYLRNLSRKLKLNGAFERHIIVSSQAPKPVRRHLLSVPTSAARYCLQQRRGWEWPRQRRGLRCWVAVAQGIDPVQSLPR